MPTIKSVTLNPNGSLKLLTDSDIAIDIAPRILLAAEAVFSQPTECPADLVPLAVLNLCADLTDRITHQEARLSELVNFIRNIANALPKPAEVETPAQPDTASPTDVSSEAQPDPEEVANPEPIPPLPKKTDTGPKIVQVTSLTPKA